MTTTAQGPTHSVPDADVFIALADQTRRDMLQKLVYDGATSASALARDLPISRQAIGKHLDVLQRAHLVRPRRAGREVRYEPELQPLKETSHWMNALTRQWERRLTRLAQLAESGE